MEMRMVQCTQQQGHPERTWRRPNKNLLAALQDIRLHPTNIISKNLYSKLLRDGVLTESEKNECRVAILALYNHLRI